MKRNLILGAATGYDYCKVEPFLKTLRRTNFDGDVCLLVADSLSYADRQKFLSDGVILITLKNFFHSIPKKILDKRFSRRLQNVHKIYPSIIEILFSDSSMRVLYKSLLLQGKRI